MSALAAALGALLMTATPDSVAIIVLSSPQGELTASELHDAAREALEASTAFEVAKRGAFASVLDTEKLRSCAGDAACFADAARTAGVDVDLLLTMSADRIGASTLLGLRLIDLRSAGQVAAIGPELPEGVSLRRVMSGHLERLFSKTSWWGVGAIEVRTERSGVTVRIGRHTCIAPCVIDRLPVGPHTVVLEHADDPLWTTETRLAPGGRSVIDDGTEPAGLTSSPWFWGAVGAGALAAGIVTAVLVAGSGGGEGPLCFGTAEAQCQ